MPDEKDHQAVTRGRSAEQFLKSPLWAEAWEAYRDKLLGVIESADSADEKLVMHAKRLLTAGIAAKSHLERLVKDGTVAAESIKLEEQRRGLFRR